MFATDEQRTPKMLNRRPFPGTAQSNHDQRAGQGEHATTEEDSKTITRQQAVKVQYDTFIDSSVFSPSTLRRLQGGSCRCNSIKPAIRSRSSGDSGSCAHTKHKTHSWGFLQTGFLGWILQLGVAASRGTLRRKYP